MSWILVWSSKMILLRECKFKKNSRLLFNYLIAEKWLLMHFTKGKKTKNQRFFKKVFFMFFDAPYRSNSLRIPKKFFSIFVEIFEKKNCNNFGRHFLASWFYYRKKTRWKTLVLQNTHRNLCLSWKSLRCSEMILLRAWKF